MSTFKAVLKAISSHEKFLVTTHHNPDADAIASALAMALFLRAKGKRVTVLNEDACPVWLKFLPSTALLKKAADIKKVDYTLAIALDCGDLSRVGGVKVFLDKDKPLINIDHHVTNDHFGNINVIIPHASSTCEMVFDLFKEAKFKLNKNIAVLLYAGIMTDTGSFRYDNTTAYTHAVARDLMAFGISAPQMYERLYTGIPVLDMKLFTEVIHEAQLLDQNRVYAISLTQAMTARFSQDFDLKEKLFNFLRTMQGIEVIVILTEIKTGEVRINLRSQGKVNVAAIALQFEGGGHKKAAGAKIYDTLANATTKICQAIHERL